MDEPADIVLCTRASQMLAEAKTVPDFKKVADMCAAAATWARRHGLGKEAVANAVEYEVRAKRGMGMALLAMPKQMGARGRKGGGSRGSQKEPQVNGAPALSEMGVTKRESFDAQTLAIIPEKDFESEIAEARANDSLASSRMVKKQRSKTKRAATTSAHVVSRSGVVSDLLELAGQKFACIYADPPWRYGNQSTRGATNNHYETMTVEQICALPIRDLAADKAHLHLWTTNGFLFECPRIFAAWGFEFKSSFVWVKPQMGMGNYWRNSHELMLLGVRGELTARDSGQMSWLECRRGEHSAKPDAVRDRIEKLSPGPRLELFGRGPREGWVVFGNQVLEAML